MPTLHWIGKEKVINHHQEVPFRVLEHKYGFRSADEENKIETKSGNKIIHGDNLEALKALLPEYEGRIKCIYIDPPYNTGNEKWIYNDNVNDPKIKKWLGEVVGKQGEDLSRHDKWLCMMYPRLKLLHKLLADDGAIFISIDDNEQANLKLLCDEIFGMDNAIGPFIQNKLNAKNDTINIQKNHEFVLVYRKNKIFITENRVKPTLLNNSNKSKVVYKEGNEYYYINDAITTRGEGGVLKARPNLGYTIYYNPFTKDKKAVCDYDIELAKTSNNLSEVYSDDLSLIEKGYIPIRPPKVRGQLGCWTWELSKFNKEKKSIIITGDNGNYAVKKRTFIPFENIVDIDGRLTYVASVISNSKSILDFSTNDGTKALSNIMGEANIFDNPKNVEMIEYLIELLQDDKMIVLDSFAGSGTTAHAVLNLNKRDGGNRKFILIEREDYVETITAERIKRVAKGYSYKGKNEVILYSEKLTVKNISNGENLLKEAEQIIDENISNFDKISKPIIKDNCVKILGTKIYNEFMIGTGGEFDYYELGLPIFTQENTLNEEVNENKIREYIYYTETRQLLERERKENSKYLLDTYQDTGYYFYYEKGQITTLSLDTLNIVTERAEQYVIYADNCIIDENDLAAKNIVFKKISCDIKRF